MYQITYNKKKSEFDKNFFFDIVKKKQKIAFKAPIFWEEHCVECAVPTCYNYCSKFVRRSDEKCARFVNGIELVSITDNKVKNNLAFIKMRPWGKLEADLSSKPNMLSVSLISKIEKIINLVEKIISTISIQLKKISPTMRLNSLLHQLIMKLIKKIYKSKKHFCDWDGLLFEYIRFDTCSEPLNLEIRDKKGSAIMRDVLPSGSELQKLFIKKKKIKLLTSEDYQILISNFSNETIEVAFLCADIVKFDQQKNMSKNLQDDIYGNSPSPKYNFVKCVVFDLDNTLWDGVIGDDGAEKIILKPYIQHLIIELDRRGILCSISSKNEFETAFSKIKELGLEGYFLYPQINWNPKSSSIIKIASKLNLGLDSFAFIDDNKFEREEVANRLPLVKIFDEHSLKSILDLPAFSPPITDQSKTRRLSYLAEINRNVVKLDNTDSIHDFLIKCEMEIYVFNPENHFDRCIELLGRTNQFNISGKRYEKNDFKLLLSNKNCFCIKVKDKFGDYGIVAFVAMEIVDGHCWIEEFVMSCRIAEKHLEETILFYIYNKFNTKPKFYVKFNKTSRNAPIRNKLINLGFVKDLSSLEKSFEVFSSNIEAIEVNPNVYKIY